MKRNKITALTLGVLLSSSIVLAPVEAMADSKEEIKNKIEQNDKKIDELKDKKDGLQDEKSERAQKLEEAKANFDEQNKLLTETREKVLGFQKQIDELQKQIDEIQNQILLVEKEISDVKVEIEEIQANIQEKQEILGKRIRSTYMNNIGDRMIYMLIESKSIGDLISNISNISLIIKTDQQLIQEIEEDKLVVEDKQKALEAKEADLNNNKLTLEDSQNKIKESKAQVDKLEQEYALEASKLKALEEQRDKEYSELTDREKAIQAEIEKYNEDNINLDHLYENLSKGPTTPPQTGGSSSNGGNSSGGGNSSNGGGSSSGNISSSGFIMPLSATITSYYGPRTHPLTGKPGTFHTGVDFGAGYGTPIKAIASGTVTTAGWNGGYGNTVIVDHGNGYSSLYAHASSLNVSVGQKVGQGQVLSFVGSTGNSTGNHLHLEMRYNGSHVNPLDYIK